MNIGIVIVGVYLITLSFLMETKNFISKLLFQIISFFSGLFLLVVVADRMGIVTI